MGERALCYKPCGQGEKDAGLTCYAKVQIFVGETGQKFDDFVDSIKNSGVNEIMKLVEVGQ